MTNKRLEILYRQKLVRPEITRRTFPLAHLLTKDVQFFPERPADFHFDVLEIGPGNGDFLIHEARLNPNLKFFAIELERTRLMKIKKKAAQNNITNITLAWGDARIPLHKDIPDASLSKCFVLFPDPWPRNKHSHRRLLQQDFVQLVCQKLKPNGIFTLATDVKDYATWVLGHLQNQENMQNTRGASEVTQALPDLIPTVFEQKWKKLGRDCWYLRFRKI